MSARLAAERVVGSSVEHIESVPLVESLNQDVLWEGVIEVFKVSQPPPDLVFVWAIMGDKGPDWTVVLASPAIRTPTDALRSWMASTMSGGMT